MPCIAATTAGLRMTCTARHEMDTYALHSRRDGGVQKHQWGLSGAKVLKVERLQASFLADFLGSSTEWMLGSTPPAAMVTPPSSLDSSSSLRTASWMWRGTMRVFLLSRAALPASSSTSAVAWRGCKKSATSPQAMTCSNSSSKTSGQSAGQHSTHRRGTPARRPGTQGRPRPPGSRIYPSSGTWTCDSKDLRS